MIDKICKNCNFHRELTVEELSSFLYECVNEDRPVIITTFVYHNETCDLFDPIQEETK